MTNTSRTNYSSIDYSSKLDSLSYRFIIFVKVRNEENRFENGEGRRINIRFEDNLIPRLKRWSSRVPKIKERDGRRVKGLG